jgi:DHA1 family bicyclomycin/chloramphenicol resistance-like MFS transporter
MTDTPQTADRPGGRGRRLGQGEFVAMMAVLFATIAFSIDAMLPALPEIAAELTPEAVNRAQLVLTAFVLGMGAGTLIAGPISDAVGRKSAITAFVGLYILGAVIAAASTSIEVLLAARVLQGLGAAGPRIISTALVRDMYEGRAMARIMSFVMMVFVLIPSVAPFVGSLIIAGFGWRGIFGAFVLFGLAGAIWLNLRQEETLPPERRRPLRVGPLKSALVEVLSHRMVLLYILVLTLGFGQMFAFLSSIQQIYAEIYDKAESFPLWFAVGGVISGGGTIVNATLVMRLGMRRLAIAAFATQTVIAGALLVATLAGLMPGWLHFPAFWIWSISIFFMAGLTFGNLNALALQPLGHIAGMAASVVGAISTVGAVFIAAPIGLAFNGTLVPLAAGTFLCSSLAWWLMRKSREADPEPKRTVEMR